jgi:hypothetical protein
MSDVETIHVRGEGGTVIAMDLPLHEAMADRLTRGQLQRVNPDGTPYTGPAGADVPGPPDKAPAKAAGKGDWVAWAIVCGATADDAEALTKADLIDKYADAHPATGDDDEDPAQVGE